MDKDIILIARATGFAARAHLNQRRKGAAQEPYVNHVIEVMELLADATGGTDAELLAGGLLHDTIEDCGVTADEIEHEFGPRVARLVTENSDDMSMPLDQRRALRIAQIAAKPKDSRMIKIADVISNVRAMAGSPPAGWTGPRKLAYLNDCRRLVSAGKGTDGSCGGAIGTLEALFFETADKVEASITGIDGADRPPEPRLNPEVGDQVHLVYLVNTSGLQKDELNVARFAELVAERFPSVVVQEGHGHLDGQARPVLVGRLRSNDTDMVVALAQHLCDVFSQSFVGIEVGGRYIRVYAM
jgi:hypothetical protein